MEAAAELHAVLSRRENVRGEMVLLLSGERVAQVAAGTISLSQAVRALIKAGTEEKDALKQVARERGMGKSDAYREWQRTRGKA